MAQISELFDLSGEIVVITGGAGFLGAVHAEAIVEAHGIPVLLDVNEPALEEVLLHLRSSYPNEQVAGLRVDITNTDEVARVHAYVLNRFQKVDALINNAAHNPVISETGAMALSSRFETMSINQWNADLAVGLTGAFLCAQAFGSSMAKANKGSIINISSDLSIIGPDQRLYMQPGLREEQQTVKPVTYTVVKTGIIGLTRYLATYWANKNVRVNALSFGGVLNKQSPEFLSRVSARIPMGRLANRDEYKGCIVFMCSAASSYMTGANVIIDGGRTVW